MANPSDRIFVGQRLGRWFVLAEAERSADGHRRWLCRCGCGTERIVDGRSLRRGATRSCGCLLREVAASEMRAKMLVHGHAATADRSPTYRSWRSMIGRCTRPTDVSFKYYGARGIEVCERWRASFVNFLADMGERPTGLTLDRVDVEGNYEPGNCRWATRSEQERNKRKVAAR